MSHSQQFGEMGIISRIAYYLLRKHDAQDVDRRLMSRWLSENAPVRVVSFAVATIVVCLFLLPILTVVLLRWIGAEALWTWWATYFLLLGLSSYLLGHASASILEQTLVRGGWGVQRDGQGNSSRVASSVSNE